MSEIIPLLICLESYLSSTSLRHLRHVVFAMLCNPHRATMLGLSRWTESGGSYRTLQRFYHTPLNWVLIHWALLKTHRLKADGVYLLAGDEVVVDKAGKKTHGLGKFYSSLAQRVIPSVSVLALSVIDVTARQSYPLCVEQIMPVEKPAAPAPPAPKRQRGRPNGSTSHAKAAPVLSPLLCLFQQMMTTIQAPIAHLQIKHVVLDGKFGNYPSTWTVRQAGYHIISKMRHDAALYFPYTGAKPERGATPRYGDKLNYQQLPSPALVDSYVEDGYRFDVYQMHLFHKDYPDRLNVVVIVKTHLATGRRGHVVLFSTDLDLSAEQIIDYYSLRFQIEFNFRDAKQYWGLDDFMNVSPQAVTNAINLAFLMINLSHVMLQPYREHEPLFSIIDLKAQFQARRYLTETIKMLPEMPEPDLISRIWQRLARFGGIRTRPTHDFAA